MTLKDIDKKMHELAKFAVPSKNYNRAKAEEFYRMQKLYWVEKNKPVKTIAVKTESSKHFVNSYGEATTRDIGCQTYRNQQKRLNKKILNFLK